MIFKGWVRASLIDFPERIATVLFTGGCNFRCPMCHNAELVLRPAALPDIPAAEVLAFLERRAGKLTGVVITGGEPTLWPALPDFLREVRMRGYAVKLDTNGYEPATLAALLEAGLLDYVAMDVKAPPGTYARLSGLDALDLRRIERSLTLLRASNIPYELRTTVVPGLLDEDDIAALAQWIAGAKRYVLQQFRGAHTLDPALHDAAPYALARLEALAQCAAPWVQEIHIRG